MSLFGISNSFRIGWSSPTSCASSSFDSQMQIGTWRTASVRT